ncbi:MAG TPA: hypothetical protein PLA46_02300 [Phycicoccus sp.]|nr:hypothetical protein [Phycicoccus sp.]HQK31718.1 hypothetical protein [Phycicoccus sp.]HQV90383.1 hypothetical protein [Phycicoccus sp.]HQY96584.1 hypothetical protein [Phycicoccus sp.]HRA44629.1 hypothetical protein [Phycicoccus sp.]
MGSIPRSPPTRWYAVWPGELPGSRPPTSRGVCRAARWVVGVASHPAYDSVVGG